MHTRVLETRRLHEQIYRRRRCFACGASFVTKEMPVPTMPVYEIRKAKGVL